MSHPHGLVAVAFHEVAVGGASRSILRILPLLESLGWRFTSWTPGPGPLRDALEATGNEVAGTSRLLRYSWRSLRQSPGAIARLQSVPGYLREFQAWVRAQNPDVLHANTLLTIPEALSMRRRCPTVLYAHETLPSGLKGAAAARAAHHAAHVVVGISNASAAGLRRRGLRPLVIPNGVPLPDRRREVREGCGLVIGMLGTVCRRKGSDLFVEAACRLRPQLPTAEFRLIGACVEGPERAWAEEVVREARLCGVRRADRAEPYSELSEWDIAVVPSRDEPFGLVAAEAMAAGVPVVATHVGGLPEVIGEQAGVLVEPDDPEALVQAILELAADRGLRSARGEAGRLRVERQFTLEQQASAVNRVYSALGSPPKASQSAQLSRR